MAALINALDRQAGLEQILTDIPLSMATPMIELTLPTMTCGHCVRTVTETVQKVDADAKLQIDLPTHQVRIDSSQPAKAFADALTEEGYTPA